MALADRFSSIDELLAVDENELNKLGINNQADRTLLIKQARLLDDKVNDNFISNYLYKRIFFRLISNYH
jgi:hypothetical protein